MAWIALEDSYCCSPKFTKLARRLGIARPFARGLVSTLWSWCTLACEDGDLRQHDNESLADVMEWPGDPDALIEALVEVRLLDRTEHGLAVHNWRERTSSWKESADRADRRLRSAAKLTKKHDLSADNPGQSRTIPDCPPDRTRQDRTGPDQDLLSSPNDLSTHIQTPVDVPTPVAPLALVPAVPDGTGSDSPRGREPSRSGIGLAENLHRRWQDIAKPLGMPTPRLTPALRNQLNAAFVHVGMERLEAVLAWWPEHRTDEWVPQIGSLQEFPHKFAKIEAAMARQARAVAEAARAKAEWDRSIDAQMRAWGYQVAGS